MKLILVRHGETIANISGILQGQSDGELTDNGIIQAIKLGNYLKEMVIDFIYSSDLKRASDTALKISNINDLPIVLLKDLRERYLGCWEGKKILEIQGKKEPLDIETSELVLRRFLRVVDLLIEKHFNKTVVCVTHGRVINIYLSYLLWKDVSMLKNLEEQKNSAINIIDFNLPVTKILNINSIDYLN